MKKILLFILLLVFSAPAYAADYADTDNIYMWDAAGSQQYWPTWSQFKARLGSEDITLSLGLTCTDGQVLAYNAANSRFECGDLSGGITVSFTASDTTPDSFIFTDVTNATLSTLYTSNTLTVAGIDAAAAISVTGGEYQIDGGAFTSTPGTITNGQTFAVRHTSSASNSTATDTVLTIGGVSDTYRTTTEAGGGGSTVWVPASSPLSSSGALYGTSNIVGQQITGLSASASITEIGLRLAAVNGPQNLTLRIGTSADLTTYLQEQTIAIDTGDSETEATWALPGAVTGSTTYYIGVMTNNGSYSQRFFFYYGGSAEVGYINGSGTGWDMSLETPSGTQTTDFVLRGTP